MRVRVVDQRRRFARAEMIELLEPGASRVEPRCSVYGRCGGCTWQHLDYPVQVAAKEKMIRDALERIAGQKSEGRILFTPSPVEYGYRVRTRMLAGPEGLGYRERASHTLCPVDHCPVLAPGLEAEIARVNKELKETQAGSDTLSSTEWELVADSDGQARSTPLPVMAKADSERSSWVSRFEVRGRSLRVSPGSFVQANGPMHEILFQSVLEEAGEGERALELHAGAGFFTLGLVDRFRYLEVVEASATAVADLRVNLAATPSGNLRVRAAPAESIDSTRIGDFPDCVIMDPPRAGLSLSLLESVAALNPARIVYLSCDPATLARDLARFADRGYGLRRVQGFDLFPQTPHVEVLATLIRD
ncbi:MAG: hypothetical protein CMN75_03405 [Spirochaeta sp.]|nr:hypothetical protein [Spirochaeta sp.]RPG13891.1 MAG: class I SAM-dependent RNA methyltransferase [Proteobacteria bacterium TMED72]